MAIDPSTLQQLTARAISAPLVTHLYTADPSAHVFEGRIYIYPSHDIDAGIPANDLGDQYAMEDYHVFCQDSPDGEARDCGAALHVRDVPWAAGQMWAPDAATRDGRQHRRQTAIARKPQHQTAHHPGAQGGADAIAADGHEHLHAAKSRGG